MTVTINLFEVIRFIFIFGWTAIAGFVILGWWMTAPSDWADRIFNIIVLILCLGSAIMLYMGR